MDELVINGREYVAKDTLEKPSTDPPVEEVYTVEQLSQMTGVSKRVIYSLMDRHVLKYIVPNGCTRPKLVRRLEYEKWIGLS